MRKIQLENYTLIIFSSSQDLARVNDNIDIEIIFPDKKRYFATFFTVQNVKKLMDMWQNSGENNNGTYFWSPDMVIVREITDETIISTIDYMIAEDELTRAFVQGDDAE